jgi:hypothetical protein
MDTKIKQFRAIVTILALIFIEACGQFPLLFQPTPRVATNPLVDEAAARGILVQPLDGVSKPMSKLVADAVVEGFQLHGFRATTNANTNSLYSLKGKAEINKDMSSQPYVALITWTLFDYLGKSLGSKVMGVPGSLSDWYFGSPVILAEIGKVAPDFIFPLIEAKKRIKKLNYSVIKPNFLGVWINQVTNAPGDGNALLTSAIKKVIQNDGILLAEERQLAKFFLDANVHVGLSENGLQRVEIVWRVSTPESLEVGQATQNNTVKAGMFSETWGNDALIVAQAALEGIKGILNHARLSKPSLVIPKRVLKKKYPSASRKPILPPPSMNLEGFN